MLGLIILTVAVSGMAERAAVTEAGDTEEAREVDMEEVRVDTVVEVAAMAATERTPKKRKIL